MIKNYEQMSDFEVNVLIAGLRSVKIGIGSLESGCAVWDESFNEIDYCNNPSDAWPIIIENKICINAYGSGDGWSSTTDTSFFVDDDNPLRAAMICFLKMKDNEQ